MCTRWANIHIRRLVKGPIQRLPLFEDARQHPPPLYLALKDSLSVGCSRCRNTAKDTHGTKTIESSGSHTKSARSETSFRRTIRMLNLGQTRQRTVAASERSDVLENLSRTQSLRSRLLRNSKAVRWRRHQSSSSLPFSKRFHCSLQKTTSKQSPPLGRSLHH